VIRRSALCLFLAAGDGHNVGDLGRVGAGKGCGINPEPVSIRLILAAGDGHGVGDLRGCGDGKGCGIEPESIIRTVSILGPGRVPRYLFKIWGSGVGV
jgi:hypothetical protein